MPGWNEDQPNLDVPDAPSRTGTCRTAVRERHVALLRTWRTAQAAGERDEERRRALAELAGLGLETPPPDPGREARVRVLAGTAFAVGAQVSAQALLWPAGPLGSVLCLIAGVALIPSLGAAVLTTATSLRRLWRPVACIWAVLWLCAVASVTGVGGASGQPTVLGNQFIVVSLLAAAVVFFSAWTLGHHVQSAAGARRHNTRIAATRAALVSRLERLT